MGDYWFLYCKKWANICCVPTFFLWLTAKIDTKKISFTAVFSHEYSYGIYNPSGTQQFQFPVFQLFLWNQPYSIPLNCNPTITPLFKNKRGYERYWNSAFWSCTVASNHENCRNLQERWLFVEKRLFSFRYRTGITDENQYIDKMLETIFLDEWEWYPCPWWRWWQNVVICLSLVLFPSIYTLE